MSDTSIVTKTNVVQKIPSMWKVILHNDDYTPIDFVTQLLEMIFHKSPEEANVIAQHVHTRGRAQVGLYTKEIALTKTEVAQRIAQEYQHPLLTTAEEA